MNVEEIKRAVQDLEQHEIDDLVQWLTDYQHGLWDRQIEEDLEAGRLNAILDEVQANIDAGRIKPL